MEVETEAPRSLRTIAAERPLIHRITNVVVTDDSTDLTLGFGALPVMAYAPEEVAEMAALSQALVLDIGTLSTGEIEAMLIAARAAAEHGVPIIHDRVGAGATRVPASSAPACSTRSPPSGTRGSPT